MKARQQHLSLRDDNPVVFMDISAGGGSKLLSGGVTQPKYLGRLHFELRKDLVPIASANFLALIDGVKGFSDDGIRFWYKGSTLHRVVRDAVIVGGDLNHSNGNCSRSIYTPTLFNDENFILLHTGPGVLSMCNRGPDTNGSLFQITLREIPEMNDRYVVFGYGTYKIPQV